MVVHCPVASWFRNRYGRCERVQIKILGTGCPKCSKLAANVRIALEETEKTAEVVKVTDMAEIMEYDIMLTPALVIDEQVKISGRVATVQEIKEMLKNQ